MNKFIRIALLGLTTSVLSLNSGLAQCGSGGCGDDDKKDKKEKSEDGDKKE